MYPRTFDRGIIPPALGRYVVFPLTPSPYPRKEGKGKSLYLSPSLFTGEGFGVGDTSAKSKTSILFRIIPPVLFSLLFTLITRASAPSILYATLGPEAPSILRVLIGDPGFVAVEPGHLADVLKQRAISTLIVPQD